MQGSFVKSIFKQKTQQQKRQTDYRKTNFRYVALLIACLVVFGCEYCFDTPSALQQDIQKNYNIDSPTKLGQTQFNLLYSLYAFPNVIVPLIGGIMIDKVGSRIMLIITCVICVIGQTIYSVGGLSNIWAVMLLGRVIFGIGGEVLHAAQNTLMSNWFKASELSLALGVCISFPKMGSSLNAVVSTAIAQHYGETQKDTYWNVAGPLFFALILMVVSLFFAFLLAWIDKRTQKLQKVQHESALLSNSSQNINNTRKKNSNAITSVRVSQASQVGDIRKDAAHEGGGNEHLNFKQIKNLPATFWLLMLIAMLSEALFIPFLDNGNIYYQRVFNITNSKDAGIYLILPYVVSSILVPVMGYAVDKVGRRGNVIIVSCGFILGTYIFMMYLETSVELRSTEWVRWVPTALLGGCIAIFCTVIVPTVPMIVKPSLLGTGLGIMEVVQNAALGLFPLIAGAIRQTQHDSQLRGFHYQTLFFFVMACLCFAASIWLKLADVLSGSKLDVKDFKKEYVNKVLKEE